MDSQEIKAEERNAIFGEIILGYSIFEEASLKTNSSHWKPYLWRKLPLKAVFLYSIKTRTRFHGIQVMMPHYQRFGEQERSSRSSASILPFCIRVRVSAGVQSAESPPS